MTPDHELRIHHLGGALRAAFERVVTQGRAGSRDLGELWAMTVGGYLDGLGLDCPPLENPEQPWLPFLRPHRIEGDVFHVARGGMAGGPAVDVLLQVWLESEDVDLAWGLPLLIRRVPSLGPMPPLLWEELRETCRLMGLATPCGRVVLVADGPDFRINRPMSVLDGAPAYVVSAHLLAGTKRPPHGMAGGLLDHFAWHLAAGTLGDPAMAGRGEPSVLETFLRVHDVRHVVRLRIVPQKL